MSICRAKGLNWKESNTSGNNCFRGTYTTLNRWQVGNPGNRRRSCVILLFFGQFPLLPKQKSTFCLFQCTAMIAQYHMFLCSEAVDCRRNEILSRDIWWTQRNLLQVEICGRMTGRVCRQYRAHCRVQGAGLQSQLSFMLHYYTNLMGSMFRLM